MINGINANSEKINVNIRFIGIGLIKDTNNLYMFNADHRFR